ncbi:hemolysin family protein [Kitasatospora sp. NPDC056327]|uniref:hemolysin family protein n=1 Tax=Kitasatospora sp. NPDC056327 TaxID=3345785 RepID=UPI0035E19AC7
MTALQLTIGLLTIVANAFFVGGEFALISVRRSQIEPRAEAGDRRARTVMWGLEHVSAMLATAQLGITVSSLVLGMVAEPAIAHLLEPPFHAVGVPEGLIHPIAFVVALAAATYLHMLLGEMIPKNIALAAPERAALLLVPPLVATCRAVRPVVFSINGFANRILRLLRVEPKDEVASVFTEDELARMVKDSSDAELLSAQDTDLLHDALELGSRPVSEVVTPSGQVVFAGPGTTPAELERLAARTGYSRFPVLGEDGAVAGYLHIKDALEHDDARDRPFPVGTLRPIARVPGSMPLDDVLTAMRRSGTHLAAAVAADGTALGLVTMEDVLKELVRPAPAAGAR